MSSKRAAVPSSSVKTPKERQRERTKVWSKNNPDKVKAHQAKKYQNNKHKYKERIAKYNEKNADVIAAYHVQYNVINAEKRKAYSAEYNIKNKDTISAQKKQKYAENPEPAIARAKKRYLNSKESMSMWYKEYKNKNRISINKKRVERYATDMQYKLSISLRVRLSMAVRAQIKRGVGSGGKKGSAVKDLGCTLLELMIHLEERFLVGQTWENWGRGKGKWNIDHVIPISSFDLTDPAQCAAACHYTNLQPLWYEDNMKKNTKQSGVK